MANSFGGKIELKGWKQYRQALQTLGTNLQKFSAEQKLVNATFDKSDKSLGAFQARSKALQNTLQAQKAKQDLINKSLQDFTKQLDAQRTKLQSRQSVLEQERAKLQQIADQSGKASNEYKTQAKIVNDLEKEVDELTKSYDASSNAVTKTEADLAKATTQVLKTSDKIDKLGKEAVDAGYQIDDMGASLSDSGRQAESAANGGYTVFKNVLANLATNVIQKVTDGVRTMATSVYDAGKDFDSGMSRVEAISGATSDEMEQLTAKAKEMGATTKFTATEATDALYYMSMAGWKANDMLAGLPGVMNLAAASGEELSRVSDIVTDALTAMGYTAKDSQRFADVLAASTANANVSVDTMGATFKYVGAVAGSFGYSMEDVAESIAILGNSGIKAEMAGTALRSVMMRLATDTGKATQAANKLGVKITDNKGNMRDWSTVMDELRKAFGGLSEEQQSQYAKTIAGTEAMNGFLTLMNATETDVNKVRNAIQNADGAAEKMANTMNDNVGGQMTLLKSKLEGVYLVIWEKVEPTIRKFISTMSKALDKVDWNKFGEKAAQALQKVADGIKWLIDHKELVVGAVQALIAAFAYVKIMQFTSSLSSAAAQLLALTGITTTATAATTGLAVAQGTATTATTLGTAAVNLFNAAWAANPIGLVVTALGLLAGGIALVTKATSDAKTETNQAQEVLKETSESLTTNKKAWEDLANTQQETVNKGMTEVSYYQTLADELDGIVDKNGKVKKGYEERASFITGQLAEALGLEISYSDGVVKGYSKIKDSIDDVIAQKKAKIQLDAQEALYTEAIQKQGEVLQNIAKLSEEASTANAEMYAYWQKYNDAMSQGHADEAQIYYEKWERARNTTEELESNLSQQEGLYSQYAYNIGTYEENMAKFHDGKYDEMTNVTWDYVKDFKSTEEAQKAILEDKKKTLETQLDQSKKLWEETGNKIYKTQMDNAKRELAENEKKLKKYTSTTDTNLKKEKVIWDDNLADTLSKITGKKIEFKKSGKGNVQMYVDGVKTGEKKSKEEMAKIVTKAIKAITDKEPDAKKAGEDVIEGVNSGVKSENKQNTVFSSISSFGSKLLKKLKDSLKEKSPSKATEEMGDYLLKGLEIGIQNEQDNLFAQMADLGKGIISAFDNTLEIHSPSKVMKDRGKSIAQGVIEGIEKYTTKGKKKVAKSAAELAKAYVSAAKSRVSELKKANKITEAEEITFWQKIVATCKKGTAGYKSAVAQLAAAKKNLKADVKEVTETYVKEVAKVNEQLEKDIAKLEETYANQVESRRQSIMSSLGLFSKINLNEAMSKEDLTENLKSQVNLLKEWDSTLDSLRARLGGNNGLLEELEQAGVAEIGTLQALNSMSDKELQAYIDLYKQKNAIAKERAETEAQDLRKETDKQIKQLQKDAKKQINELTKTYKKELKNLGATVKTSSKEVGKQITAGIKAGLDSTISGLSKDLQKQVKSLVTAAKKALKIKSPSQVFRDEIGKNMAAGIGVGFEAQMANVTKGMDTTLAEMTANLQNAIPQAYGLGGSLTDVYNKLAAPNQVDQVDAVAALKTALTQMKIEMDSEEMGHFVDKTVTKLVYN